MELNYQIALTNVPFDNSYKNVLRFDTRSEQEAYFQTNTLFSNSPDVNFNVGSLYATNVVYDGNENENINELLNKNYCIVKDKRENATIKYYYYYITNAKQDCDNRILLALELDIFQTYYIDLNFSDSMIYKAHLDRFLPNNDGTVSFDGTLNSKLFEREDIQNVSKRLSKRTVLSLYDNSTIGNWLKENIACWLYIYYDPLQTYDYTDIYGNESTVKSSESRSIFINSKNGNVPSNIAVFVYPIYKNNKIIKFNMTNPTEQPIAIKNIAWGDWLATGNKTYFHTPAVQIFANKNDGYKKIYSTKVSILPPFNTIPNDVIYSIDNGNLVLDTSVASFNGKFKNPLLKNLESTVAQETFVVGSTIGPNAQLYASSISAITNQESIIKTTYSINKQLKFTKEEIINSNKDNRFNPKLLNNDYFELTLSDASENGFVYDFQKLNNNNLEIGFTEPMTPDMTKRYIRILSKGGIYSEDTQNNLTGFVNSNDNSLIMPTSAFQDMLANNKNFFLQKENDLKFMGSRSMLNFGKSIVNGAMTGGVGGAISQGAQSAANSAMEVASYVINTNLSIDNLKNAPSNIIGAKGNITFENMYTENGIVVEEHEILDNEKEIVNDYMCMFGFTYNRVDNIKNVDNIRKIYNFVRADIETINSSNVSISETVRKKFRECFANGVRFWNTDTFAYNKENYERWLENE